MSFTKKAAQEGKPMAFFLRPKSQNRDRAHDHINAEAVAMRDGAQDRYTQRAPGDAREAEPGAPLPGGNWRNAGRKIMARIGRSRK